MEQKLKRDMRMGDNLRRLRLDHGYSQEKLCAVLQRYGCDIGRSAYSQYEAAPPDLLSCQNTTTPHRKKQPKATEKPGSLPTAGFAVQLPAA